MRGWRNWQTHYLEVVAPARAWRFESSPAHKQRKRRSSRASFSCLVLREDSNGGPKNFSRNFSGAGAQSSRERRRARDSRANPLPRTETEILPKGTVSNSAEFAPRHSAPPCLRDSLSGVFLFLLLGKDSDRRFGNRQRGENEKAFSFLTSEPIPQFLLAIFSRHRFRLTDNHKNLYVILYSAITM